MRIEKKGTLTDQLSLPVRLERHSDAAFRSGGSYIPLKQSECWGSGAVNEEMQCDILDWLLSTKDKGVSDITGIYTHDPQRNQRWVNLQSLVY